MQRLELDFLKPKHPTGWASWALLGLALVFLFDLGRSWISLRDQVARHESRPVAPDRPSQRVDNLMKVSNQPIKAGEIAAAHDAIRRLSVPWESLFGALESAQTENASLLSIEPDADRGTVTLTGEAKDYLTALSYVANLESQRGLTKVSMTRHEVKPNTPQRPVLFVISASWRGHR